MNTTDLTDLAASLLRDWQRYTTGNLRLVILGNLLFLVSLSDLAFASDIQAGHAPSVSASLPCQAKDFQTFLNIFVESVTVQKAFTQYPLKFVQVADVTAEPQPKTSVRYLKKANIKFPLLLNQTRLSDYGLEIDSEERGKGIWVVIERSAGEKSLGHYVEYKFMQGECWKLVEINNQST